MRESGRITASGCSVKMGGVLWIKLKWVYIYILYHCQIKIFWYYYILDFNN